MNVKAEMRGMCLQAKEHQRWQENHQKLEEGPSLEQMPFKALRKHQTTQHLDLGLLASRTV